MVGPDFRDKMNASLTSARVGAGQEPAGRRKLPPDQGSQSTGWQPALQGGRLLYGGLEELGVSLEWHDFELGAAGTWVHTFPQASLVLCLNLAGQGSVRCGPGSLELSSLTAGFFSAGGRSYQAARQPRQRHRFATVAFTAAFLRQYLAGCDGALHPLVEEFLRDGARSERLGQVSRLTTEQEQLLGQLVHPAVFQRARPLWYQSKVLQLMVEFFFERRDEDELLCDRQKRLARERSARVIKILRERLAEPPTLEALGREVGCSSFYLSRTFSQEMGMTIPQYLRKLRMERAAELLRNGRHNVTEAALEVGYSSLSHFSQAFCQVMGCCPGLYPLKLKP